MSLDFSDITQCARGAARPLHEAHFQSTLHIVLALSLFSLSTSDHSMTLQDRTVQKGDWLGIYDEVVQSWLRHV